MTKFVKVRVDFIFAVNGTIDEITKSIHRQINTDLNEYWQNDDGIADMVETTIYKIKDIGEYKQ